MAAYIQYFHCAPLNNDISIDLFAFFDFYFHGFVFFTGKAPPNLPPGVPPLLPNPYIMAPGLLHAYPVSQSTCTLEYNLYD